MIVVDLAIDAILLVLVVMFSYDLGKNAAYKEMRRNKQ
jgi:hypothetical protein